MYRQLVRDYQHPLINVSQTLSASSVVSWHVPLQEERALSQWEPPDFCLPLPTPHPFCVPFHYLSIPYSIPGANLLSRPSLPHQPHQVQGFLENLLCSKWCGEGMLCRGGADELRVLQVLVNLREAKLRRTCTSEIYKQLSENKRWMDLVVQ